MTFTREELALLRAGDGVVDAHQVETDAERRARHSRESRERRRQRMGDEAYRAMCRERHATWLARCVTGRCPVCDQPLPAAAATGRPRLYCCERCKDRAKSRIRRGRPPADAEHQVEARACAACGAPFLPRRSGRPHRFCYGACADRARSRRGRQLPESDAAMAARAEGRS